MTWLFIAIAGYMFINFCDIILVIVSVTYNVNKLKANRLHFGCLCVSALFALMSAVCCAWVLLN